MGLEAAGKRQDERVWIEKQISSTGQERKAVLAQVLSILLQGWTLKVFLHACSPLCACSNTPVPALDVSKQYPHFLLPFSSVGLSVGPVAISACVLSYN